MKVKPASVRQELSVLKHMLNLAVGCGVIPITRAHGVKSPNVPSGFRIRPHWLIARYQTPVRLPP